MAVSVLVRHVAIITWHTESFLTRGRGLECRETRFNRACPGGWWTTDSTFGSRPHRRAILVVEKYSCLPFIYPFHENQFELGEFHELNSLREFENPVVRSSRFTHLRFKVTQSCNFNAGTCGGTFMLVSVLRDVIPVT